MLKLVKLVKLAKNKENLQKEFHNGLKVSSGYERLAVLFGIIFYLIHLFACFWLIIGSIESSKERESWLLAVNEESKS